MSQAAPSLEGQTLKEAFAQYEKFTRALLDAYVVINQQGQVIKSNQLFSQLVGRSSKQVIKAPTMDDMLELFIKSERLSVEKILEYENPTRFDEVTGKTDRREDLNLIIGVYPFIDEKTNSHLGSFLIIRDVTAETNLQDKYRHTALKSITDQLTGLYTRSYFEDYFNLQLNAFSQLPDNSEQRNISIVIVDIDHFKVVNDDHGHQAGDFILKEVAKTMAKTFRKTDILCRYGGEEFLMILPTTDIANSIIPVEKFRTTVAEQVFKHEGNVIPITLSAGIAQILVASGETYEQTISRADAALYQAKREGRNRVCIHNGSTIKRSNIHR